MRQATKTNLIPPRPTLKSRVRPPQITLSQNGLITVDKALSVEKEKSMKLKSVCFSKNVHYKPIRSIREYEVQEIEALWYTDEEYRRIRENCKSIVRMMMKRGIHEKRSEEKYCGQGLECRTRDGSRERSRNRGAVRYAVIMEQQLQREAGKSDPALIAQSSYLSSLMARKSARDVGIRYAAEVALACSNPQEVASTA